MSNKNLPLAVRKKAYQHLQGLNQASGVGMEMPDIPDEAWESKSLNQYLVKAKNVMGDKNIPLQVKMESLVGLEQEAMAAMNIEDVGKVSPAFAPAKERIEEQAFATGMMFRDRDESPILSGQLLSMSQQGRGVLATRSAVKDKTERGYGRVPKYIKHEGAWYLTRGAKKPTLILEGSLLSRAIGRAERDKFWDVISEEERVESIEMYVRIYEQLEERKGATKKALPRKITKHGATGVPDGSKAVMKTGEPIIVQNGEWITDKDAEWIKP